MKFISRTEEFIMLSVWMLKDNSYGVPIQESLKRMTGQTWAFGALFVMLNRLEKKGLLDSFLTESTPQRGGRSKRIYKLTPRGKMALLEVKQIQDSVWANISVPSLAGIS